MIKWTQDWIREYPKGSFLILWYKDYTTYTLKIFGFHVFTRYILNFERQGDRILYQRKV